MLPKMDPAILSLATLEDAFVVSARPVDADDEGAPVDACSAAGAEDAHDGSSSPSMVIGFVLSSCPPVVGVGFLGAVASREREARGRPSGLSMG